MAKGDQGKLKRVRSVFWEKVQINPQGLNSTKNAIDHKFIGTGAMLSTARCYSYFPIPSKYTDLRRFKSIKMPYHLSIAMKWIATRFRNIDSTLFARPLHCIEMQIDVKNDDSKQTSSLQ
ncbi:hypothetical protein BFG52_06000 [Acinetobacter larvae]|uniref:Uncharacterized protein n=1 Tax=Acinetobacter larvae TaxID=1789224 RepID=A0A1B2LYE4_9GAMM|nr:hypothetical protein BFG52_06000 [Acinetobacter larvae]